MGFDPGPDGMSHLYGTDYDYDDRTHGYNPQTMTDGYGTTDEEIARATSKEKDMNYPSVEYYDERIRLMEETKARETEREIARLEAMRDKAIELQIRKDAARERFGTNNDWPDESVISYKMQYNSAGVEYTFVAVKVGRMGGWYTTNKQDRNWYTFDELVDKYLSKATSVHFVSDQGWEEL